MAARPEVVVVGAGIVGASVAWHLARAGASVTVAEGRAPGGLATPLSWAWINASWGHPPPYARLRIRSMDEWRRLGREVPGLEVNWCGGLVWDLAPGELRLFAQERGGQGYDVRLVEAGQAGAIEPALLDPPALAAHAPGEGSVEPLDAALLLLADAERRGARLVAADVARVADDAKGVRLADGSTIAADAVVLAAGAATARLAEPFARIPLDAPPGLLLTTEPAPPLLNGIVVAPGLELRQMADGRLLVGGAVGGSDPGEDPEAVARELFEATRATLKGGGDLRLGGWTVGHRPVPADGVSIAGEAAPNLWVAVTHSGVTLAPALGMLLADEIMGAPRDPLLRPFGPERFKAGGG